MLMYRYASNRPDVTLLKRATIAYSQKLARTAGFLGCAIAAGFTNDAVLPVLKC